MTTPIARPIALRSITEDARRASRLFRARGFSRRERIPFHSRDHKDAARPRDKFPSCRRDRRRRGDANYSTRKREARKTKHALAVLFTNSRASVSFPVSLSRETFRPCRSSSLARSLRILIGGADFSRVSSRPRIGLSLTSSDSRSTETNPGRNMIVNAIDIVRTTIRMSQGREGRQG